MDIDLAIPWGPGSSEIRPLFRLIPIPKTDSDGNVYLEFRLRVANYFGDTPGNTFGVGAAVNWISQTNFVQWLSGGGDQGRTGSERLGVPLSGDVGLAELKEVRIRVMVEPGETTNRAPGEVLSVDYTNTFAFVGDVTNDDNAPVYQVNNWLRGEDNAI